MATFLGIRNQQNVGAEAPTSSHVPRWKKLVRGVVSSLREKTHSLFGSQSTQETEETPPQRTEVHSVNLRERKQRISEKIVQNSPTVFDLGNTSIRLSPDIEAKQNYRGVQVSHNGSTFYIALDGDGQLTKESKEHLRKAQLMEKIDSVRTDFSHRIPKITKKERILAPGNIHLSQSQFPKRNIIQLEYRLVHSANSMPNTLLITLNDQANAPSYAFPVTKDDEGRHMVNFPSDAPKGSLERRIFDTCFSVTNKGIIPLFHKAEFISQPEREGKLAGHVAVHATLRSKQEHKARFPELQTQEYASIHISPVSFPKLHGDTLRKVRFDALFSDQKMEGLLYAWRESNASVFLESTMNLEESQSIHTAPSKSLLQIFYERFHAAGKRVTPGIQAWLLEQMPKMSVSEVHAFIQFDELLREQKFGRLFPIQDEYLVGNAERIANLRSVSASSLDMNLLGVDNQKSNKGMLMGDVLSLYPIFHENLLEQKDFISSYFLNQAPKISIDRWVSLVNNAEEHFDEFSMIQSMTPADHTHLEETSVHFQQLYQDRMHLKALMQKYASQVDDDLWEYLMASFDNTLRSTLPLPQINQNSPVFAECIRRARACQEGMIKVNQRVYVLRTKLTSSHALGWKVSKFDMPYTLSTTEPVGVNVVPEVLKRETFTWIQQIEGLNRVFEQKKFALSEYNKSSFRALIKRGKVIADSFRVSSIDPIDEKKILNELYVSFLTSGSNPVLLALYLEMYLQIAQHEKGHYTFIVTQVMIRKYISMLPESSKKEEITSKFLSLQKESRSRGR